MSWPTRRAIAVAVFLAAGALACRKKAPPPPPPPPPRPADVVVEVVVPDPAGAWTKSRQLLGLVALPLPRSAFGLAAEFLGTPAELESSLEPAKPLVALGCGDRCFAAAWVLDDPGRLPTFAKDRYTLSRREGVQWLAPLAGIAPLRLPVGVCERALVAGEPANVTAHVDYLLHGLALRASSADAALTIHRSRHAGVVTALDRLAGLVAEKPYPDAPTAFAPTQTALAALEKRLRGWSAADQSFEVELAIGGDALTLVARPRESAGGAVTAIVPGEVIRGWLQAKVKKALP